MGSTGYAEKTIIFRGASMKNLKKKVHFRIKLKSKHTSGHYVDFLRQLYCCHFFIRRNHCTAAGCRRDTDRSI
mgnify:CR=1 FL=1